MLLMLSLLLASCLMSWTTAAFNNTTFCFLTRFDSKFDMREACCWRSNDAYKNSRSSRIKKEWLGNVPLSLRFSATRSLTLFCRYFPVELELISYKFRYQVCTLSSGPWSLTLFCRYFPTKNNLQIQCREIPGSRSKKIF